MRRLRREALVVVGVAAENHVGVGVYSVRTIGAISIIRPE